jgi:hypothetical protein
MSASPDDNTAIAHAAAAVVPALKNDQLKTLCSRLGLTRGGNKPDLVARIVDFLLVSTEQHTTRERG